MSKSISRTNRKKRMSCSCTGIEWSPNGHFCVSSSCYTENNKQDVALRGVYDVQYENGYDMWDNLGEKIYQQRYPRFSSFHFRPWPMVCLTDSMKKVNEDRWSETQDVKKDMYEISEKYRKMNEQLEMLKHIGEIRKKLDFIDSFRAKREAMLEKKKAIDMERAKLYTVDQEMTVEQEQNENVMDRVSYVEGEVIEESETIV